MHWQVWKVTTIFNSFAAESGYAALSHSQLYHRVCVCVCRTAVWVPGCLALSSLKALFSLSEHEHTDLTAEQDECAHLVTDRLATSGTNKHRHAHKAKKSKGHPDWAAGVLDAVLLMAVLQSHPSISLATSYTACFIQGRSGLRSVLACIWTEAEYTLGRSLE